MKRIILIGLALSACDALSERPGVHPDATIAPPDIVPVEATCVTAADCDDSHDCTTDTCELAEDGLLHCRWSVNEGQCFINDVCAAAGELRNPGGCELCDPTQATQAWTVGANATSCDDHDACTSNDTCDAGACVGQALDCRDDNACTRDSCDAATGCVHEPLAGQSCDDGVRCTLDDRCSSAGVCAGDVDPCDDADPCTIDTCSEVEGCGHAAPAEVACDDGDACTTADTCTDGLCVAGAPTNCDDGNSCTIDHCDPVVGCVHLPTLSPCCLGVDSVCDDRNPCTDDLCDAITGACTYSGNRAACDDENPCTLDDVCADQLCTGGRPRPCDDFNPCTDDSCEPSFPGFCLSTPRAGDLTCDDGLECTTGDACNGTRCEGDTSECVCVPDLGSDGAKLVALQVGASGAPGEGLDVDQDPTTCAPEGQCSGGIDNTLSVISSFANTPLEDGIDAGDIVLVFEVSALAADPVEVSIFEGEVVGDCDVQSQTCNYLVSPSFLDPISCEPIAKIISHLSGNQLVGGGPGTSLPFEIPLNEETSLEVVIANLRIEGTITQTQGQLATFTGLLAGAVPKQTLIEGIQSVPEDSFGEISKEAVLSLIELLVQNDIDTNGDGTKDSASIGLRVNAIDAVILGVDR